MIAIITSSMKFYYGIVEELRERGLEFLTLKVGEDIPPEVEVVITTPRERELVDFPRVVGSADPGLAAEKAASAVKGFEEKPGRIIIGIDPGRRPGVAVVSENRAVDAFSASSPVEVRGIVTKVIGVHKPEKALVRVGSGGGIYRMQILKQLGDVEGVAVEIVDEHATTKNVPEGGFHAQGDARAALNIALKTGTPLKGMAKRRVTAGEIKNIQKESRVLSGNLTISKALAGRVAAGELTLEEAVKKQRKKP